MMGSGIPWREGPLYHYVFPSIGEYRVRLQVKDDDYITANVSQVIHVMNPYFEEHIIDRGAFIQNKERESDIARSHYGQIARINKRYKIEVRVHDMNDL